MYWLELAAVVSKNWAIFERIFADKKAFQDKARILAVMKDGEVVEQGLAGDVFGHPRHPYTRALLDSIPGGDFARKHETSLFT